MFSVLDIGSIPKGEHYRASSIWSKLLHVIVFYLKVKIPVIVTPTMVVIVYKQKFHDYNSR